MTTPMRLALGLVVLTGVAHADSVLVVSHQMKSAWHGYVVFLDGQRRSDADANAKRISGVLPGRHELSVNIVSNPFKPEGKPLCVGPIDVPDTSEMRLKCEDNGGITVIGVTSFAPPPPPPPIVVAPPPQDPRSDADGMLAAAAQEMSASPPACQRLLPSVQDIRYNLSGWRRGRIGRHRLGVQTSMLADQARDVCAHSTVVLLKDAASAIAPYDNMAAPAAPQPVNPDQLAGMRSAIIAAPAGRDRLMMASRVTRGSWFTTRQLASILRLFPYPAEALVVLRDLAPRLVDPQMAGPILDCFPGPERNDASAILSR